MNLTTDSGKLQSLIAHALIGTSPSLQSKATVSFNEEAVHLGSMYQSVVSCYGNFKKSFFANGSDPSSSYFYKAAGSEYLVLTSSLLKSLMSSFGQKPVRFHNDKEKIYMETTDLKTDYEEPLAKPEETVTPEKFPVPMITTEYGFMPKSKKEVPVKLFVKASDLSFPKGTEELFLEYNNSVLKSKIEGYGKLRKEIDIVSKSPESDGQSVSCKLSGYYLSPIVSALQGNVWLMLHKEAVLISETDDAHGVTYMVAAKK